MHISFNWCNGTYDKYTYFRRTHRKLTKLIVDSDNLYINFITHLKVCKRSDSQPLERGNYENIDIYPCKETIVDFSKRRKRIFAITAEGTALIYDCSKTYRYHTDYAYNPNVCADFYGDVFVIGASKNCKILNHIESDSGDSLQLMRTFDISYNGVEVVPNSNNRFVGFRSATNNDSVIHEVDIEKLVHKYMFQLKVIKLKIFLFRGITKQLNINSMLYQYIKHKDENTLYVADGVNYLFLYDRRTDKVESTWLEPFDSSFHCLDHDGLHGIIAGSNLQHICLYDARSPGRCVQVCLIRPMSRLRYCVLPIYSIACDSRYAFVSIDTELQVLDFKNSSQPARDGSYLSL